MAAYTVDFSDSSKTPISITTGTIDESTSLKLIGRNAPNYGEAIAENLLHLLENFADNNPPVNPIEGQLWYDNQNKTLNYNDGIPGYTWYPVAGVHVASAAPSNVKVGDIWSDTTYQQLKIYNGSDWILVGPNVSGENQTGAYPDYISGTDGDNHSVIKNYLDGNVVSIIAQEEFTPVSVIDGFSALVPGINLSSDNYDGLPLIFNGLSFEAANLKVSTPDTETVSADNFVRTDINQSVDGRLTINNDSGLRIGETTSTFELTKSGADAVIISNDDSSNITFKINKTGVLYSILTIDGGDQRVGINQASPLATLDVVGSMKVSSSSTLAGLVYITSNTNIAGNLGVSSTSTFQSTATFKRAVVLGEEGAISNTSVMTPATSNMYDLGSSARPFKKLWVDSIGTTSTIGTVLDGQVATTLKLASTTTFSMTGQVATVSEVTFDGATGGLSKSFSTKLTNTAITGQATTSTVSTASNIIVSNADGLYKVTKSIFLSDIIEATPSSGMVTAWSGPTTPTGWLVCDGASYNRIGPYNSLYTAIGTTYGSVSTSTFNVPEIPGLVTTGTIVTINYIIKV